MRAQAIAKVTAVAATISSTPLRGSDRRQVF